MNQSGGSITKMPIEKDEFTLGFDIPYETTISKYQTEDGKKLFLVKIKLNVSALAKIHMMLKMEFLFYSQRNWRFLNN